MKLNENVCLKQYTTIGCGGPARYLVEVTTPQELQQVFQQCSQDNLPFFILGKGSNTIFHDKGFSGVVIVNKMHRIAFEAHRVYVQSGFSFSHLGVLTAKNRLSGLEFAAGIPASVGGAIFMNAGASGQETQQSLEKVVFMHADGKVEEFEKKDCLFGYRSSIFHKLKGCILAGVFNLTPSDTARAKQLEIISYRTKSQPYGDKSAGCFFKNPPQGSAGALIDQAGLKGAKMGGAKVSLLHGNFLINNDDASSEQLFELAALVQKKVWEKSGVTLELEVRTIPYEGDI